MFIPLKILNMLQFILSLIKINIFKQYFIIITVLSQTKINFFYEANEKVKIP